MNQFSDFPKIRPKLPPEYEEIYKAQYKENREGKTLFSFLSLKAESWQHVLGAKDFLQDSSKKPTLEIGAGTLNHLQYEPGNDEYDIIEPMKELYESSDVLNRVRNIYADISNIPANEKYGRIVSFNVFEHICNLPEVVACCGLALKKDGTMRIGIPSEGTYAWQLSWRLTRGIEVKVRYGLDYGVLMKYEHVNTATEVERVLAYFFNKTAGRAFGLSRPVSLYQFYECSTPDIDRCNGYLNYIKKGQR